MRRLFGGYDLVEAPCLDAGGGVYFSDIIGGGVYRLDPGGAVECVITGRRRVGGIVLHADGGIVFTGRSVVHSTNDVQRELLAIDGVIFNDLCCDEAGRIWVGGIRFNEPRSPGALGGAIYRIDGAGVAVEVTGGFGIPNGMGFTPDGMGLYVVDSATRLMEILALDGSGQVISRRTFADLSQGQGPDFDYPPVLPTPDGLAVDEAGGVWVAIAGGGCVQRYAPDGALDLRVDVPASRPTSLALGGDDRMDLYITTAADGAPAGAGGGMFRTRSPLTGLPVPPARV